MSTELLTPAPASQGALVPAKGKGKGDIATDSAAGRLYLAFRLAEDVFAIDILSIREIFEYSQPTSVPVIDLAIRFGRPATGVGKRTCIVIVEVEHAGATHVLGLMVDGVNAVMEIAADNIEAPPSFGTRVNTEFIAGMARVDGRFIIILDVARVLSIEEIAAIKSVEAEETAESP